MTEPPKSTDGRVGTAATACTTTGSSGFDIDPLRSCLEMVTYSTKQCTNSVTTVSQTASVPNNVTAMQQQCWE
jgi:hypothetical protein